MSINEQQRLYLIQARSDWKIFEYLRKEEAGDFLGNGVICHRLLYIQMCSEKLAKAYFWKAEGAGEIGHAAFKRFILSVGTNRRIAEGLRFHSRTGFQRWLKEISPLALRIERLAPALAGDGPNPEYPWPRRVPTHAPIEHHFELWDAIQLPRGQRLLWMVSQFLTHFEAWV